MTGVEHVQSLRQQVTARTSELHALQRELMTAERSQRRQELHVLAESQGSAVGAQGMVIQAGRPPDAVISRGFPTSRSEIDASQALPVAVGGNVHADHDSVTVFQVPKSRPIVPPFDSAMGETGKGPALVQLFR